MFFTQGALKRSRSVKVNVAPIRTQGDTSTILLQIQDAGPGLTEAELDVCRSCLLLRILLLTIQNTVAEFEKGTDTNLSPDETDGALDVDIPTIGQYVRSLNGQIEVTSELETGTIFSLELPFEIAEPRIPPAPANLCQPSTRSRTSSPPSPSPPLKDPKPVQKETRRRLEATSQSPWTISPRSSSLLQTEKALTQRPRVYDQPPNVSQPRGELTNGHQNGANETRSSLANLSVLVAEDDPVNLRILEERLSQWGHTVDIACDGQECHDRFAANWLNIDVILMDTQVISVNAENGDDVPLMLTSTRCPW